MLTVLAEALGWTTPIPHWTTGRSWLLRLGHAMLTAPKAPADDWAWLIDHSVQIGQEKCLVILGIRLKDLPPPGQCLVQTDLQLLALVPRQSWTREEVDAELEATAQRTGSPRVIVDDHGGDLTGGVQFFQARHAGTLEIYDAKHKAACVLKGRLEKNERWQEFQRRVGQTRCAIQQTALAFLVPPAPKPKSRFMNLDAVLRWASNVLTYMQSAAPKSSRLPEKLGWLHEFADDVKEWHEWQQVSNRFVAFVNRHGIYRSAAKDLKGCLPRRPAHASSMRLVKELIAFVALQARRMEAGERFPGSTEILESCFGRFKHLEKQQARGGFTNLLLGFGALLAETTPQAVNQAMKHSPNRMIPEWCRKNLGSTLLSQRRIALALAQQKADEN